MPGGPAPAVLEQREPPARRPPAARLLPDHVFYGWYVAVACAVLMFVGVGVGYYGLAVFLRPLQEEHGWSNGIVSAATGLYFSIGGITGALVGPRVDRHGPLRVMLVGCLLLGATVATIGLIDEVWQLFAVYAVLAVAFATATGVGVNVIMARWFVTKRAKAMSISSTGVSVGGVVLVPVGTFLVDRGGLDLAAPVLGVAVVVVAVPVVLGVLVWDPRQMGLLADNGVSRASTVRPSLSAAVQQRVWSRRGASRTVSFWAILVGYVLVLPAQTGFLIHQLSFLEDRFGSRETAAFALSTTAMGSIIARLIVGTFADRIEKRSLAVALFVLQGTAVLGVVAVDSVAATYVVILVFGFTIGNVYMMQTLLVGEVFGFVSFGAVFGLIGLAGQIGSGIGPFFVGWLEERTGSYDAPFVVTAIVTYVAAAAISFARGVNPPPDEQAAAESVRGQA